MEWTMSGEKVKVVNAKCDFDRRLIVKKKPVTIVPKVLKMITKYNNNTEKKGKNFDKSV
ncbi:MAG TPA: hypothetical protein PK705_07690 [Clostridia bacterium]|nr:hypothetical protein [Clostridia bacterium]